MLVFFWTEQSGYLKNKPRLYFSLPYSAGKNIRIAKCCNHWKWETGVDKLGFPYNHFRWVGDSWNQILRMSRCVFKWLRWLSSSYFFPLYADLRKKKRYFRALIIQLLNQTVFFIFVNMFEKERAFDWENSVKSRPHFEGQFLPLCFKYHLYCILFTNTFICWTVCVLEW